LWQTGIDSHKVRGFYLDALELFGFDECSEFARHEDDSFSFCFLEPNRTLHLARCRCSTNPKLRRTAWDAWKVHLLPSMSAKPVIARLDGVLKPLGFERQKTTWNRKSGSFVDVVEVQTSKAGDTITINAGVVHPDVHAKCWGDDLLKFIEEPSCTVRVRIGQLIGEKDLWWKLDAADVADDIADKVNSRVLPFLEQMHSTDAMEQFLTNAQVVKQKYPPPIIYLAILKHQQGNAKAACALLGELERQTVGAWQGRISQIAETLSCS
jgi:Domain of unknown function (DUF4304)